MVSNIISFYKCNDYKVTGTRSVVCGVNIKIFKKGYVATLIAIFY